MEHKEIEIRSEAVQEVMGRVPPWILRWGITLLFIIVIVLLVGGYFFKYPDVIVSEMTLTSHHPVAQIVARASGKISQLYVTDGQEVTAGTLLAVIENPAKTESILALRDAGKGEHGAKRLEQGTGNREQREQGEQGEQEEKDTSPLSPLTSHLTLGDVQPSYTSYLSALHEYENFYALNYYPKKIAATREQVRKYRLYYQNQQRQQGVTEAQFELARQQYVRDSALFVRGVISPSEHETARSTMLQSRYTLEGGYASLENLSIQISELETTLLDMELQQAEKEAVVSQNYRSGLEQLSNAINSWELTYCLTAPIDGRVTFVNYWNENQFVTSGESVFSIVPDKEETLIGKAQLPIARSGKVKAGQRVIIRFDNFPDQEFGVVNGVVNTISLVPADNNYQIEIGLPEGLTTNYGKTLPVTHEMKASAEIVTADLRLLERLVAPIKRALKEGL